MDKDRQKQMIEGLKNQLRVRGISPDKYVNTLLSFQTLLNSLKTHDELEVAAKVTQAMMMCLEIKHAKFHQEGKKDERGNSDLN